MNLLILFAIILGMIWGLKSCLSAPKRRKPTAPKPPSRTTPDPNLSQKKGAVGEQIIKVLALKHLPASQYRHFGNLIIPHGQHTTQIDNIIVSPFGLFVIEAKHFAGWIYGQAQHKTWTHTLSHHSKFPFQNPLRQNYSGFNLNQDKATATAVYTEYIRELTTLYWFKLNPPYKHIKALSELGYLKPTFTQSSSSPTAIANSKPPYPPTSAWHKTSSPTSKPTKTPY